MNNKDDYNTVLMEACERGHTACALALIATPAINVNHATVSINILIPSLVVVGREAEGSVITPVK